MNIGKRLDIKIIITALNRKKKRIRENEIQRGEDRRERRVEDGSEMCKDDNIHWEEIERDRDVEYMMMKNGIMVQDDKNAEIMGIWGEEEMERMVECVIIDFTR